MSNLVDIIKKIGIIPLGTLEQMHRWGLPVGDLKVDELKAEPTAEGISRAIAEAIEGEGYVLTRETDLEAIPQYLSTMQPATLHVFLEDGEKVNFEVQIGLTKTSEWILPWQSENITDMLTNGESYLRVKGKRVYFSQARELFYGERKAFVLCTPSTVEPHVDAG